MTPHDRALELLKLAKRDENAAHVLQADSSIDDGTIGFHYQQAAEKLLKGDPCRSEYRLPANP